MQRQKNWFWVALALCLAIGGTAFGQGVQTGTLVGTATSNDGSPLPGVMVTVSSGALQGERSATTVLNGDFVIRALPPGSYKVVFGLEGMKSVERTATVVLGGISRADAVMEVAAAEETIVVTGEAPSAMETTTIGANITSDQINALPVVARTPVAIADLAGGLTDNGTVAGQVTIGGAFAYDNVFLIDGVDFTDRAFGYSDNLFIEDAIEETQVLTAGISAEYGRFSGGVINAITKSGSNTFSGSFRTDLTDLDWRDETPYQKERNLTNTGDLSKVYSATLGGAILKDRLWFFLAGRDSSTPLQINTLISGIEINQRENTRYEAKLTWALSPNHSVQGSYTNNERTDSQEAQVSPREAAALSKNSKRENDGWVVSYNGVFSNSMFGEARYSEKHFGFRGLGGTGTRPQDSPFVALGITDALSGAYNAPYFDATDPEDRDNKQIYGALSYFLSTESLGSHDLKVGVERFSDIGIGGNSQTPTGYVIYTDYLTNAAGNPVYTSNGSLIPFWYYDPEDPASFYGAMAYWLPVRGAKNEIQTTSFFVNDRWSLNKNFSFNVGVRYEDVASKSQSGIPTIGSDSIVPRLGATYDVRGDGKYKFDVTYSQYSGKATATQFGAISPSGNPSLAYGYYVGPVGLGADFAPGFDLNNYVWVYFSNPTGTKKIDKGLKTPKTEEIGLAAAMALANGGYLKLSYQRREVSDFIETLINHTTGLAPAVVGPIDGGVTEYQYITNSSVPQRKYEALLLEGKVRLTDNWSVAGNWTWQLKNEGNFEGEAGQSPAIDSLFGDFPEVFTAARNYPYGKTDDYQEHKVRLWTSYSLDLGRAGAVDFGLVGKYDSPLHFSYAAVNAPLSGIQMARGAGYYSLPMTQTLFFGPRGAGEYNAVWSLDFSAQYAIPVWKSVEPWVKFAVTNLTNEDTAATFNTTVSRDKTSPVDANGLYTGYTKGTNFGKATTNSQYQLPREYFVSLGIRF